MSVSMDDIKKLREETGVSIMQCKKALEEVDGDMEKAKVVLRKISKTIAEKKSDRELGSGAIQSYIHSNNRTGSTVILGCETDFVAKNDDFVKLAYDIAMHVTAMGPQFLSREDVKDEDIDAARTLFEEEAKDKPEEFRTKIVDGKMDSYLKEKVLLEQGFVKDTDTTINTLIEEATQKFGEKIAVVRFERFSV